MIKNNLKNNYKKIEHTFFNDYYFTYAFIFSNKLLTYLIFL